MPVSGHDAPSRVLDEQLVDREIQSFGTPLQKDSQLKALSPRPQIVGIVGVQKRQVVPVEGHVMAKDGERSIICRLAQTAGTGFSALRASF